MKKVKLLFRGCTRPEINISPENRPLEKEIPIGNQSFQGLRVGFESFDVPEETFPDGMTLNWLDSMILRVYKNFIITTSEKHAIPTINFCVCLRFKHHGRIFCHTEVPVCRQATNQTNNQSIYIYIFHQSHMYVI